MTVREVSDQGYGKEGASADGARDVTGEARVRLVTPLFLLITAATFAYFLAVGTLIPSLPLFVAGALRGTDLEVGIAVGSFALSAIVLRPLAGALGDRYGRKLLIVAGALGVAASIGGYAFVSALAPLVALRIVTGVGEAFFYTGAASAINDLAPDDRRGEALSFFSLALYSGLAVGPIMGETLVQHVSFDAAWFAAASCAAAAAALGLGVGDTRPPQLEPDTTARLRLLHPAGLAPGVVLATSVWGLAGFSTFVPLYAPTVGLGGSRLVFALYSAIVLAIRSFGARLPDRLGHLSTARGALAFSVTGLCTIAAWPEPAGLFIGTAVFAIGQALAFPALMSLAVTGAPPAQRGAVVGTFTAFFDLSIGLGAVSLGAIAGRPLELGYRGTFVAAAAVAGIGFVLLTRRLAHSQAPAPPD
jgi:MFS family permease